MGVYNAKLLEINKEELLRYAGIKTRQKIDEKILEKVCEETKILIKPRGIWEIYNYNNENQTILSEEAIKLTGKLIGTHLKSSERVACMAVTIGEEITNEVTRRFEQGDYFFSLLLDAAGTATVEQVADEMEKQIRQEVVKEGCKMKWRYSPGYGDWSLDQQLEMFKLSKAAKIGMKLSEAKMLIPRKSITAIIGLTRNEICNEQKHKHNCENCNKNDCLARRNDN